MKTARGKRESALALTLAVKPRRCGPKAGFRNLFIAAGLLLPATGAIAAPGWWPIDTPQTKPGTVVNDYRPATAGQAKNMAKNAMEALDSALAPFSLPGGGAGDAIHQMVDSWKNPSGGWTKPQNAQIINQGQLKAIARPFYDRLAQLGLWDTGYVFSTEHLQTYNTTQRVQIAVPAPSSVEAAQWLNTPRYPWRFWATGSFWAQNDRSDLFLQPANVGQLKHVFDFDPAALLGTRPYTVMVNGSPVTTTYLTNGQPTDTDGDGVADLLEKMLGTDPGDGNSKPTTVNPYAAVTPPPAANPDGLSDATAARFLMQATWGPSIDSIADLKEMGISGWLDEQMDEDDADFGFRPANESMTGVTWQDNTTSRWQNLWMADWGGNTASTTMTPRLYPATTPEASNNGAGFYSRIDNALMMTQAGSPAKSYAEYSGPVTTDVNSSDYPGTIASQSGGTNAAWVAYRNAADPHERGPYLATTFPKRGIEPYMYYCHWRKLVLDRPLWQGALSNGWMAQQYGVGTRVLPWTYGIGAVDSTNCYFTAEQVSAGLSEAWLRRALYDPDQLRQRVAWALSQILVVSTYNGFALDKTGLPSVANYYDLLTYRSFRRYEDLLLDVTFHPLMAHWLTYINSAGATDTADTTLHPDENYAREIMQLFSMGLHELNDDGTPKLDAQGNKIFTYTQEDVRQLARVFTGMISRSGRRPADCLPLWVNGASTSPPHDVRSKTFLGLTLPANAGHTGATAEAEIRQAVRHIANRSSVAPYICRQLIQHLVTSNPSPAYVRRVVKVWRDAYNAADHLGQVVRAVLTDPEANSADTALAGCCPGRLKDPMQRTIGLMRAFHAGADYAGGNYNLLDSSIHPLDGPLWGWNLYVADDPAGLFIDAQQMPFLSPSVFSFFAPGYAPAGDLYNARLLGPEYQLLTSSTAATLTARLWLDTDYTPPFTPLRAPSAGYGGLDIKSDELVVNMVGSRFAQVQGGSLLTGGQVYDHWIPDHGVEGFGTLKAATAEKEAVVRLWHDKPFTTPGSTLTHHEKALRLHFGTLASGTAPKINGTTPADRTAYIDQLDTLLCLGRMTPSTRAALENAILNATATAGDDYYRERAALQALLMMPEASLIR